MCGIQELIDRGHSLETISAVDEDTRIAREGCRIARDRDHGRDRRRRERPRLRLGALPWRIEHDGIEALEFDRHERSPKEVAPQRLDRLEALRPGRGALQGSDCGRVVVGRGDAGAFGEPQREWSDAAEQVGHRSRPGAVRLHQPRQDGFARRRCLQEGARRQDELGASDPQYRLRPLRHHLSVASEAGETAAIGDRGEVPRPGGGQRT